MPYKEHGIKKKKTRIDMSAHSGVILRWVSLTDLMLRYARLSRVDECVHWEGVY